MTSAYLLKPHRTLDQVYSDLITPRLRRIIRSGVAARVECRKSVTRPNKTQLQGKKFNALHSSVPKRVFDRTVPSPGIGLRRYSRTPYLVVSAISCVLALSIWAVSTYEPFMKSPFGAGAMPLF